ncbi:hypothetical protein JRI60_05315 [Archangium violaceum]|uniref:hypothetical protein n=1 Tax=Archangium violaceum TaxID=83451 RepID=UPI00194F4895|nr:hypothetical protein [Archangium violaceum]QRN98475.1 hypothetical protein JRI60_05315 [Archangium violaceum]
MKRTLIAVGVMLSLIGGSAMAGTIDFYEGNEGTQNKIGTITDEPGQSINLKKSNIPNDEIRSLVLRQVRPGTVITLYDDPRGRASKDDWARIYVFAPGSKSFENYLIPTFERSETFLIASVKYHRKNGLDGKVSHIKVECLDIYPGFC